MTPDEYCQQKAAQSGSSFYYSFRFLEETRRLAITALYAFCREVDDAVDECSDERIAREKLAWWRMEVAAMFQGNPSHPVSKALLPHLENFNLAEEYFLEIIDGMQMDLDFDSYATFKELSLYCYRAASAVGLLSVEIFGYEDRKTLKYAHDLGMAFQLTNIIRDVHEDALRGRVYLPQDELKKYNITNEQLLDNETTEDFKALMQFQTERARKYYQSALAYLPESDRFSQRSGIIMAEIYLQTLNEIENDGFRVLEHRIKLTPIRKLWIAWTSARREKKRFRKADQRKVA
ncbi:MAG: presqualene diphosphate synthase HpnD [Gammaproteobacteria bacterium]|nr:presqualene diphosphate synthase HpnD [Gammaproteobacteria bacterium]MDH5693396.1 presqualene diphosphate synthase HpnD [Gammaproteobacteria bacterium]